jgi:tRNA A-37 threonylcarbamoyl transferase component Bud32
MDDQPRRPAFFWLVLLTCVVYAGYFAFTAYAVARYYGVEKAPGWDAQTDGRAWYVATVDGTGPAAGLIERGDRLLAINGDERYAVEGLLVWCFVEGGKSYRVDLERRGERVSFELPLPVVSGQRLTPILGLVGLAFFICGAALALLRPHDPQVRLAGAFLMSVGFATLYQPLQATYPFLVGWERIVHYGMIPLCLWTLPLAYHFFSRFPEGKSPGSLWRGTQWLLYAMFVLLIWPAWLIIYLNFGIAESVSRFILAHPPLFAASCYIINFGSFPYIIICFVLTLIVIMHNYHRLRDRDSRRRIKWVVAGVIIALIPFVALNFAFNVVQWIRPETYWLYYPLSFLTMLCIPASIAAAVWKEQLFDIRVLVRRGLQYLFARTALQAFLALPIALLAISVLSNPNRTVVQMLTQGAGWLNVVLIVATLAALRFRRPFRTWLDRRFFRENYQQEQVLVRLIDEVRQQESLAEIAHLVTARLDAVLHPTALHIFYREREDSDFVSSRSQAESPPEQNLSAQQTLAHAVSTAPTQQRLSQQQALLAKLDGSKAICDFPSDFDELPAGERDWLESLGVRLVVPITGTRDRLVGVLLLGARMSDEPYSATDRRLLEGIAAQIGLVYENQHLRERVRLESDVRRDVLARLGEQSISLLKECPACGACYDSAAARCEKDGRELMLTLPIERTLDDRYRLERALGRGGFGVVYEATDLRLQRRVAAKIMMGSSFGDAVALRRFEREARAAAKIEHRHITRVHDYGTIGSGGAYLIMELVAGRTWREQLKRPGLIAPLRAAEWFRQLLDGLQFAHNLGVVHRDLKPENVMIVETANGADELKIMDFGLAKVLSQGTEASESLTQAGAVMGTFGYIAPEVFSGGPVDERADLFAIGVMVVETLVGARPFNGQTPHEIITSLLHNDYHLPGESPEIRALDVVVQRCLAKDPRDRYGSASEAASELVPTLARCSNVALHQSKTMPDTPALG